MVTLELDTIANKSRVVAKEGEDERMKNISMEAWLKQNEDRREYYAGIRRSRGVSFGKDQGGV